MSAVQNLTRARAAVSTFGKAAPEAVEAYQKAREELNNYARDNWDNPEFQRQVARDIVTEVDYGFSSEYLFGNYFNISQIGEFDREIVRERRGLRVFYTSRGGYIEESQIRDEMWEMPRDTFGFHVSEHIDKLRANFADTIESLVSLGQMRMEAEVYRRAISLMQAAIPAGSPNFVSAAGLTQDTLNSAIRAVRDAIRPDGTGPVPITIIGRSTMTDKIMDFPLGFDVEAIAALRTRGQLGQYRGAQVVTLHNFTDQDEKPFLPANELWVFGGNVGKFVLYGGSQVKQWDENTVDYRHYRCRRDMGGMIHHPEQARRIIDTTQPA